MKVNTSSRIRLEYSPSNQIYSANICPLGPMLDGKDITMVKTVSAFRGLKSKEKTG